ncbi:MAG: hypothetical protein HYY84_03955 [Deltaproteobacteria bacterium]|nr:hypothetical protein [Deltaproteobacteria bacterium]
MAREIEARAYGPDSTDEERETLRARITLFEPDVVLYREAPIQTPFQLDVMWGRMAELTAALPNYYALIDLTHASRPPADVRFHLRVLMTTHRRPAYTALFTEANFVLNVAARFVMASAGMKDFSVHRHRDDAIAAIHMAKGKGAVEVRGA